jgi:signal transduction histidine kinase
MARILIVDDEKSIRITLRAFLKDAGYDVAVAEDAQAAQAILKRETFDVVVSDIILPRVSGVALLKQIRETAPDVQVIMMTGEPTVETAGEAVRAGASDYLTKPVGKLAILHAVAIATRIKELEDAKRDYQATLERAVKQRTQELAETVEQLKASREQAIQQERMHALGRMASGIAHDFNNVLMPIMGFSEMLLSHPQTLDDRQKTLHMLEMIHCSANDARHIVRRLRLIYKEEDPVYLLVDLARLLESVMSITMPKWKEEMNAKGTTIRLTTQLEEVPLVKGNAGELREALTNLVFNAVDAMPDGGTITLTLQLRDDRRVALEVSDTGIGMDEGTAQHCLEPFFTTKGIQGTGLGLPMVCGIVQRHGGDIEIDSEHGVGTTVRLQFPVPVETDLAEEEPELELEPLPPLRVLVIDDEARSRNLLGQFLKADGHTVEMAEGGEEGVDLFSLGAFDLVITDRAMPTMSGDRAAAEIANLRSEIPIIMLTGFGDIMKDKGECPPGVSRVMSKPVTPNELRHLISQVMREAEQKG